MSEKNKTLAKYPFFKEILDKLPNCRFVGFCPFLGCISIEYNGKRFSIYGAPTAGGGFTQSMVSYGERYTKYSKSPITNAEIVDFIKKAAPSPTAVEGVVTIY